MLHVDNVLFEISEGEVFGLLFPCGVLFAIGICAFLIGYAILKRRLV